MRIAYHDPCIDPLATHTYLPMARAGRAIGVDLVQCADERAIEACRPDFVLAVSSAAPKVADFPSYLVVREPQSVFIDDSDLLCNVLSYDGYLTIFDSARRFIGDVSAGVRRPEDPGFAFPSPQVSDLRCDWARPDPAATLRVVYVGTNRSPRMPVLFRALDPSGILRIHGPEEGWRHHGYASYRGPMAFDGVAPQQAYAQSGIGLALLDDRCRREDIVSNHIFEIASVGAVAICPDMPWTRRWFGESVLYVDASRPAREIAEQVRTHLAFCVANPAVAGDMGHAARRIFEAHFSAERMLANAIDYHARKTAERARRRAAMAPAPPVSVVVRCGGRSLDMVARAVDSIRRQSFGSFVVILAKYRDIDLSSITGDLSGAIVAFDTFLIEGGGRAVMLWAGLRRVATPYFAVLDDDDFWFGEHMEELFRAGRRVAADFDVAFAGRIEADCPLSYTGETWRSARVGRFGYRQPITSAFEVTGAVDTNGFVARTDLLGDALDDVPPVSTAEDTILLAIIAWRSKPVFSWRASTVYRADAADGSNWRHHPDRIPDDYSLALRVGLAWTPIWLGPAMSELIDQVGALSRHRLGTATMGSQMHLLAPGAAGRRDDRGFVGRPGGRGFVSEGPQAKLRAGRYVAVFLMVPNQPPDVAPAPIATLVEPVGAVEAVVLAVGGPRLAHRTFDSDDAEIVVRFTLDEAWTDSPLDLRVFAYGNLAFTVASVDLHRDLDEPIAVPAPEDDGAAATPDDDAPEMGACADEPAVADVMATEAPVATSEPVLASVRWRVIAPLRRLTALARFRGF